MANKAALSNLDAATNLKKAMNHIMQKEHGHCIPPAPFITPLGIRHLDTLLGGGFTSSAPVAFSSTPESGKSTLALQYCGQFLSTYENSIVVYLDTESSAGGCVSDSNENGFPAEILDRMEIFGIDAGRFLYTPVVMDLKQIFDMLKELVGLKRKLQDSRGNEVFVTFVLDSIAALTSSRDADTDDPNSVIGFKARELTFLLGKFRQYVAMERINFIVIDQVRSNMQIKSGPARFSVDEKTVGTWNNVKSATNVSALQHNFRQWLFLSKGAILKPGDTMGVDGWYLHAYTEKNKLAPSGYSLPLIFDKKFGVVPIWSEYVFLREMTKTEKKYWAKDTKLVYPLCIKTKANSKYLEVIHPRTGEVEYTSDTFMERNFIKKYNEDQNFRYWFDMAVYYSCEERIKNALFRQLNDSIPVNVDTDEQDADAHHAQILDHVIDENNPENADEVDYEDDSYDDNESDESDEYVGGGDDNEEYYEPIQVDSTMPSQFGEQVIPNQEQQAPADQPNPHAGRVELGGDV